MSNTPSDAEILALAQQHLKAFAQFSSGEVWFEGEVEFARAALEKWGASQPADCTRSHPHEDMSGYCLLRTEIARLENENARLMASQPVARESSEDLYWSLHNLSKILEGSGFIDESQHPDAYSAILDAMAFVRGVTQPAAREPLPDCKAYALIDSMGWSLDDQEKDDMLRLLRTTEAEHGIKGGQHG